MPGVLSAEEAGELQTYIERTLAEFARTARRADAVAERAFLAKAEARYERGFAGCDGFPPIQARKALEQYGASSCIATRKRQPAGVRP